MRGLQRRPKLLMKATFTDALSRASLTTDPSR